MLHCKCFVLCRVCVACNDTQGQSQQVTYRSPTITQGLYMAPSAVAAITRSNSHLSSFCTLLKYCQLSKSNFRRLPNDYVQIWLLKSSMLSAMSAKYKRGSFFYKVSRVFPSPAAPHISRTLSQLTYMHALLPTRMPSSWCTVPALCNFVAGYHRASDAQCP